PPVRQVPRRSKRWCAARRSGVRGTTIYPAWLRLGAARDTFRCPPPVHLPMGIGGGAPREEPLAGCCRDRTRAWGCGGSDASGSDKLRAPVRAATAPLLCVEAPR